MPRAAEVAQIRSLATRIAKLPITSRSELASVGLLVGAIYALCRAAELDYDDARARPDRRVLRTEFADAPNLLAAGREAPAAWLAGFYVNSALMRLAALSHRLTQGSFRGFVRSNELKQIDTIVDKLKHYVEAHVSGDWGDLRLSDLIAAADHVCSFLELYFRDRNDKA